MTIDGKKLLADYIFTSKYSRWLPELKRRESWDECINRVRDMHLRKFHWLNEDYRKKIEWAFEMVRQKKVLPSMRAMQFAGPAVEKNNSRQFNCTVRHIDSIRAFAEIAFLMICGSGTGIGLGKKYLSRLPNLVDANDKTGTVVTYTVADSIEGWADSVEALLMCYFRNTAYSGRKIVFDYSKIRKKGAQLKTSGGTAPGYKPLKLCHNKIKKLLDNVIEELGQHRLKSINVYDILMHVGDVCLAGGIRRTASCVIFDLDDVDMMNAKTYFKVSKYRSSYDADTNTQHCRVWVGKKWYDVDFRLNDTYEKYDYETNLLENSTISWFYIEPQRGRSNNSVRLIRGEFTKEQLRANIELSQTCGGEPGFYLTNCHDSLPNPCFEINFIPVTEDGQCGVQCCNLSTVNGAKIKTFEDFLEAVEAETIIGTLQATYTDFIYLSSTAKKLTDEEALLGCSITGIMESPDILLNEKYLENAALFAVQVNEEWAKILGIKPAARVTCLKPEGTGSLVLEVMAPGAHAAHAHVMFRRVQSTNYEPIYKHFKSINGHMCSQSVWNKSGTDDVITFPIEIDKKSIVKADLDAIKHLEIVKKLQQHWVIPGGKNNKKDIHNNVSCTIIVKNNEWESVLDFIYDNQQYLTAISFLSDAGDKSYQQAPLERVVTDEDWDKFLSLKENLQHVDYTQLNELKDDTHLTAEASCAGGACLI